MRKFLFVVFTFVIFGVHADTITLKWMNENGTTAQTTTCETGGNINLLSAPSKPGYTFTGWKIPPYIPIEYIENVPNETYINTGVTTNYETELVADFMPVTAPSANNGCPVFGIFESMYAKNQAIIRSGHPQSSDTWNFVFFGGKSASWQQAHIRHTISISKNGYSNNENFTAWVSTAFQASPLYVFANKPSDISQCTTRIYSLQIYQNNILVHDYVPALDANNVVSLYDKVDGAFLYNAGTGELVGGPIIDYE